MEADEVKKPVAAIAVGDNLESVSVDELGYRLTKLRDEIRRVEVEIERKTASKAAASAFFKS
jgi:uncharacterized small protein (DUF1192 family)